VYTCRHLQKAITVKLLDPPKNEYTDYYDIARFGLAWKINVVLTGVLFLISIFFFFNQKILFLEYLAGCCISLTGIIYLVVTKRYIVVSYFMLAFSLLLLVISLFYVNNNPHIIEPLWLIIITIFAYFNLGRKTGNITSVISVLIISIYYLFFLDVNELILGDPAVFSKVGIILEFSLCMFIIGYIISQFIKTTKNAEYRSRIANEELNEQYQFIQLQNEEKTVLIKEIHHRVKNNLQVIISLLRLQSSEIESEDTKIQFNDAINRIMAMSLIHQKIYQEKYLSQIETSDYFKTLINDLYQSLYLTKSVQIFVTSELERVGLKTIVPLALLVSELVSNTLKHAFEKEGEIHLSFSSSNSGYFTLEYRDNGKWKNPDEVPSFGLQLIDMLIEQLEGSYTKTSDETGTTYRISIVNLDV
jgi:two-component sensor histidine kinase